MYKLIPLNYDYDVLEPYISSRTINIHYNKHYQEYLNNLNELLNSVHYDYNDSIEEIVQNIEQFPIRIRGDILYNAGGVLNHCLYWFSMGSNHYNVPIGTIKKAINEEYGSYEKFKKEFIKETSFVVGSGWTFLVINKQGKLEIVNTSNQETPYLYGLIPIIALDIWEHSYYLDYQNRRSDYIKNFFQIIDFNNINELYEQKIKKISTK